MGVETFYDGRLQVRLICDQCKTSIVVSAPSYHLPKSASAQQVKKGITELRTSKAVTQKARTAGWLVNKQTIACGCCLKNRNEEKMNQKISVKKVASTATKIEPNRKPTREQRREIIRLLEDCYDVDRECYKGKESDQSIADTCEGNVLWGWVAAIREENYGAGDGNEEANLMVKEVKKLSDTINAALASSEIAQQDFRKAYEANAAKMQKAHDGLQARHKEVNDLIKKLKR